MSFRDRMLGGVSFRPLYDAEKGAGGGGGGEGGGQGGAAPGAGGAGAGAAPGAPGAGAGGNAAPGNGPGGSAAPGAPAAGTAATLAGGAEPGAAAAAAAALGAGKPGFPDNWREILAGDDKAALKDLQRYTDPSAYYKGTRDLRAKIDSGEFRAAPQPLPANATDEQKAEWRKTNGLPEKAESYVEKLTLPNGVVPGEADKPLLGSFAQRALDKGWSQQQFNDATEWWYGEQDRVAAAQATADKQSVLSTQAELMQLWGTGEFAGNMNAWAGLRDAMPENIRNDLLTARTADGRMIGNTAGFMQWAVGLARELNPSASIVPAGGNSTQAVAAEIDKLEATMAKAIGGDQEAHRAYYGHDGKPGLEVRYRELVDAQSKLKARTAA